MKLKSHLIKKFEQFIQNPKDPNEEKLKTKEIKKKPTKPELTQDEEDGTPDKSDDTEKNLIDELNEYFKKYEK